jgi:hypothetical protein
VVVYDSFVEIVRVSFGLVHTTIRRGCRDHLTWQKLVLAPSIRMPQSLLQSSENILQIRFWKEDTRCTYIQVGGDTEGCSIEEMKYFARGG